MLQERKGLTYMDARRLMAAFGDVLEREPHLTDVRLWPAAERGWAETLAQRQEEFRAGRDELVHAGVDVVEVYQWLRQNIRPIKKLWQGSDGMKHVVERAIGRMWRTAS